MYLEFTAGDQCSCHTELLVNKAIIYDGSLYYKSKHLPPLYDKRSWKSFGSVEIDAIDKFREK